MFENKFQSLWNKEKQRSERLLCVVSSSSYNHKEIKSTLHIDFKMRLLQNLPLSKSLFRSLSSEENGWWAGGQFAVSDGGGGGGGGHGICPIWEAREKAIQVR